MLLSLSTLFADITLVGLLVLSLEENGLTVYRASTAPLLDSREEGNLTSMLFRAL